MPNLLAVGAWVLDVAFFVILILGLALGAWQGFVKGVCKIAGTVFSLVVAFTFCLSFNQLLERAFGLMTALTNAIGNAQVAEWISIAISFIGLALGVRLLSWLLGKIGTKLVEAFRPLRLFNRLLGGLLGLFEALLFLFIALAVCRWIDMESVNSFIASSSIISKIYEWDWFVAASQIPANLFTK